MTRSGVFGVLSVVLLVLGGCQSAAPDSGGILQAGNVWRDFEEVEPGDQLFSGTLFLGVDTPLSPLYLGYGRAEGGPEEFYVFVGRAF